MLVLNGEECHIAGRANQQSIRTGRKPNRRHIHISNINRKNLAAGGCVVKTKNTITIKGKKTFTTMFRNNPGDGCRTLLEAANRGQLFYTILVTGHKPLADTACTITGQQRDTAQQELQIIHCCGIAGQLNHMFNNRHTGADINLGQGIFAREYIEPVVIRFYQQATNILTHKRQSYAFPLQCDLFCQEVFFLGEASHIQLSAMGACNNQLLFSITHSHLFQSFSGSQLDGILSVGINQVRRDHTLIIWPGCSVFMLEDNC